MTASVIDTHVHLWPADLRHPAQASPEPLAATLDDFAAVIEPTQVVKAVTLPASIYPDNEWLAKQLQGSWVSLIGVAAVDPWSTSTESDLVRAAQLGLTGVRFQPASLGQYAAREPGPLRDAVDIVCSLGLVLQWTVSVAGSEPVLSICQEHPDAIMILDHLGLPKLSDPDLGPIREFASLPEMFVKLSGFYAFASQPYPYEDTWGWAEAVVSAFGSDRTMWGSDWPLSSESASYASQVALIDHLPFLDQGSAADVKSRTAERTWGRRTA